jgi:predicted  nucleic acid-binding Zn-ribbon protein
MPARSLKAAPDADLKAEIRDLKARYSAADNDNSRLKKELGQAQKDQAALEELKVDHKALGVRLAAANAEIGRLNAALDSARSKGGRDAETLAAAKQLAEAVQKLS